MKNRRISKYWFLLEVIGLVVTVGIAVGIHFLYRNPTSQVAIASLGMMVMAEFVIIMSLAIGFFGTDKSIKELEEFSEIFVNQKRVDETLAYLARELQGLALKEKRLHEDGLSRDIPLSAIMIEPGATLSSIVDDIVDEINKRKRRLIGANNLFLRACKLAEDQGHAVDPIERCLIKPS